MIYMFHFFRLKQFVFPALICQKWRTYSIRGGLSQLMRKYRFISITNSKVQYRQLPISDSFMIYFLTLCLYFIPYLFFQIISINCTNQCDSLLQLIRQMGRKQRDMTCLKPFCFYCEKSFKNEVILHHHQKAKHFSCPKCPKKFSSIDSLLQHAKSQHNQNIDKVPSATAGRDSIALKIFGMQGVPRVQIDSWISRSVNRYWGRIIEAQNKEHRKLIAELAKSNAIELKKESEMQAQHKEQLEEQLEFPLQISFK